MSYSDLLVQGLVEGCIYALIAVGLTLVYGLLRILHIAHAGIFTLGAYLGLLLTNETGSFAAAFVITVVAVGFFGMAFYRLCYEPLLDKPPHVALIASIGLFVAMEEIYRIVFGATSISFLAPPLKDTVEVAGVRLEEGRIVVVVLAVVLIGGLAVLAGRASASPGAPPFQTRRWPNRSASTLPGCATSISSSLRRWPPPPASWWRCCSTR